MMEVGPRILPGPSWLSWLGAPVVSEDEVAVIVSAVVVALTAMCTVVVHTSLGLPTCSCETSESRVNESPVIKPRFRRLFQTGHRCYLRRVVAKTRRMEHCVQKKRRVISKFDKFVKARRANFKGMHQTLSDDKELLTVLEEEQCRLAQENVDLTNKIAMKTKRLKMWAEIQRLQSLQPNAILKPVLRKPLEVVRKKSKVTMGPRPSWH